MRREGSVSSGLNARGAALVRDAARLRAALLRWYRRHARVMPWRATRDPYRIWISEVMLQQTQVATATPYYTRFVDKFPSVQALAIASGDDVLAAWAGLGYYRRARHLHEAAKCVVREHDGQLPSDAKRFGALPGVGRYTTGAVLSIAFDRPLPVLDGNVARVLARLAAAPWAVRVPRDAAALWALAEALVPSRGAGDWNQALMELGATVCTPRAPRCEACPLSAHCRALALGTPEAFPPVAARRATERVRRAVVWIERRGRVLLVRRVGPLLDRLWEPPGVELGAGADAGRALSVALKKLGVRARLVATGETVRHTITHRAIAVELWRGALVGAAPKDARLRWVTLDDPAVAITGLTKKVLARRERAVVQVSP